MTPSTPIEPKSECCGARASVEGNVNKFYVCSKCNTCCNITQSKEEGQKYVYHPGRARISFEPWYAFIAACCTGKSAVYSLPEGDVLSPEAVKRTVAKAESVGIKKGLEMAMREVEKGLDEKWVADGVSYKMGWLDAIQDAKSRLTSLMEGK